MLLNNSGAVSYVFNVHLPFVKRESEGVSQLEERWLFDALVWSYIPFIEMMKDFDDKRLDFSVGVSLSPTLLAMLRDDFLMMSFEKYLEDSIILGEKEYKRLKNLNTEESRACIPLAERYRDHYLAIKYLFQYDYERDIVEQWKILSELSSIEMLTTTATYSFLPNLRNSKEAIGTQIINGVELFNRVMKITPKGFWLPECGYYEGLEDELSSFGIRYSFCDSRAVLYASKVASAGVFHPVKSQNDNILFFPRDNILSDFVWSEERGYMCHEDYRSFHKDIGTEVSLDYLRATTHIPNVRLMTGYKYFAIGDEEAFDDIAYDVAKANKQIEKDIDDFVEKTQKRIEAIKLLGVENPVSTQIFNLDLFGQRWYEGIDWLEGVFERIINKTDIKILSPGKYLEKHPNQEYKKVGLSFSSWSKSGYAQVWIDENNKQLNREIYKSIALYKKMMQSLRLELDQGGHKSHQEILERIIEQAGRELLLAQSSDWASILHANKFNNFVQSEVQTHLKNFYTLYLMLIQKKIDFSFVYRLEKQNAIFSKFNYSLFEKINKEGQR